MQRGQVVAKIVGRGGLDAAVAPRQEALNIGQIALVGIDRVARSAAFGFFAYATYDLTNLSTLRNWPVSLSIVDLAWGTALTGVSAAAGLWISRKVLGL